MKILDRAFETTQTTGTGIISLQGAVSGFQSFVLAGNGAKVLYQINDGDASGVVQNWEIGIGTVNTGSPNTLSRNSILSSSNSNAAVNFGAGTKNVIGSIAAKALVTKDENLAFTEGSGLGGGTANAHTVTFPVPPLAYSDLMDIAYFATVANTGAMTINVNGLGAKTAKYKGGDLAPGAIQVGSLVRGKYSLASGFIELISPVPTNAAATTSTPGIVALASDAELGSGTDAAKAITASNILNALGFSKKFESSQQSITAAGLLTLAHGLGREPVLFQFMLVNTTAEGNYSAGDKLAVPSFIDNGSQELGVSCVPDATNLNIRYTNNAVWVIPNKTTGARFVINIANWKMIFRAWG